ncbi:hypothetical protein [Azospirillum aestuarii]|uniref:hypothetical protein n=1 Tax=Azospirillum aestuarii TaxID=2802052 RepID=UPI00405509AE
MTVSTKPQGKSLARKALGLAIAVLPPTPQKRVILRAREMGFISDTDTESMIAERGLKGA